MFFRSDVTDKLTPQEIKKIIFYLIILLGILIKYILPIVTRNYVHLNFTELKIMHTYSVGIFSFDGKWKKLEDLNYISVFKDTSLYEVNLWYKKNKILNLFALEEVDKALEKGFILSEKLNIDLLDARKRGYHKWVNKEIYRETGKIEYLH